MGIETSLFWSLTVEQYSFVRISKGGEKTIFFVVNFWVICSVLKARPFETNGVSFWSGDNEIRYIVENSCKNFSKLFDRDLLFSAEVSGIHSGLPTHQGQYSEIA